MKKIFILCFVLLLAILSCNSPATITNQPEILPSDTLIPTNTDTLKTETIPTLTEILQITDTPRPTSRPPISVLGISSGDTVSTRVILGSGFPVHTLELEVRATNNPILLVDANGLNVAKTTIDSKNVFENVEIEWTPWHGNGTYQLNIFLVKANGDIMSEFLLEVVIDDIDPEKPTIPERVNAVLLEEYGINISAPAIGYQYSYGILGESYPNHWASVSYIEDRIYVVQLFEDGGSKHYNNPIFQFPEPFGTCTPKGEYEILIILVDYNNTGVDPLDAQVEIQSDLDEANQRWMMHALDVGLHEPILSVLPTFAILDSPPTPGQFLTLEEIQTHSGLDPMSFDLIAQVDLDRENAAIKTRHPSAGALAFVGFCMPGNPQQVNFTANIKDERTMKGAGAVLFQHEFMHLFGWNHWWTPEDGSSMGYFNDGLVLPYLMMGWMDLDGDGVVEILDETPYGLVE